MAETIATSPSRDARPGPMGAYVNNVRNTAKSFWEGMSVTLSYMFRKPTTTQYPDRVSVPVRETIPSRYRGFLEVDMDTCTACQACERACPIQVINIDLLKGDGRTTPKLRMERFDIDIGKLRNAYPEVRWQTFEEWAKAQDWSRLEPAIARPDEPRIFGIANQSNSRSEGKGGEHRLVPRAFIDNDDFKRDLCAVFHD